MARARAALENAHTSPRAFACRKRSAIFSFSAPCRERRLRHAVDDAAITRAERNGQEKASYSARAPPLRGYNCRWPTAVKNTDQWCCLLRQRLEISAAAVARTLDRHKPIDFAAL